MNRSASFMLTSGAGLLLALVPLPVIEAGNPFTISEIDRAPGRDPCVVIEEFVGVTCGNFHEPGIWDADDRRRVEVPNCTPGGSPGREGNAGNESSDTTEP